VILLPDRTVPLRQVLVRGRIADQVTGRGLRPSAVQLTFRHAAGTGPLPGALTLAADGWYALHLAPAAQLPDLSAAGPVTLTARITVAGRVPVEVSRDVAGADLAVTEVPVEVDGAERRVTRVAGAPFELSAVLAPRPVALDGIVLRDHDPERPAAGVTVRLDGAGAGETTDAGGRFFLSPLPAALSVLLHLTDGAATSTARVVVDHSRPVCTVTLSVPG
jgi:hypothetical protein